MELLIHPSDLNANEKALLKMVVDHLRHCRERHLEDDYQLPNYQAGVLTGMSMMMTEIERLTR